MSKQHLIHCEKDMHVLGVCGSSGSGKTRLMQRLIARLSEDGKTVSAVKHAHHDVEVDTPGKDSWLMRKAGAVETMLITNRRWMLVRELAENEASPDICEVLPRLARCDWALVEGFKHASLNKIEVWRESVGKPALFSDDPRVRAVITDDVTALPERCTLPVFNADDVQGIIAWLYANASLFIYPAATAPEKASG